MGRAEPRGVLVAPGAPPEPAATTHYERVYVWQWPIRIFHWVTVLAVIVLFATGYFIAFPFLTSGGGESGVFVMAWARQLHVVAGFVFGIAFVWRMVWFVLGNRYARSGFPFVWRRSWWRDLFQQMWDYMRLDFGTVHMGHNALAGLSYTIFVIGLGLLQILTGFAIYGESNPDGVLDRLCGWVIPLLGGSARTHMWHHLFAWGFVFFTIIHVYIVMLDARQYRNGLLISMITGMKFRKLKCRKEPEER
jgi:Ni/Fe-hydrogenase 1 B-type cytochrome subunit